MRFCSGRRAQMTAQPLAFAHASKALQQCTRADSGRVPTRPVRRLCLVGSRANRPSSAATDAGPATSRDHALRHAMASPAAAGLHWCGTGSAGRRSPLTAPAGSESACASTTTRRCWSCAPSATRCAPRGAALVAAHAPPPCRRKVYPVFVIDPRFCAKPFDDKVHAPCARDRPADRLHLIAPRPSRSRVAGRHLPLRAQPAPLPPAGAARPRRAAAIGWARGSSSARATPRWWWPTSCGGWACGTCRTRPTSSPTRWRATRPWTRSSRRWAAPSRAATRWA
jgi:hypothetical protein